MMYAAPVWAPSLSQSNWRQIERPQILLLSRMIRSKPSVPPKILRVCCTTDGHGRTLSDYSFHSESQSHGSRLTPSLCFGVFSEACRRRSWYTAVVHWLSEHGLDIDSLPPFQHYEDSPYVRLSHVERNRVLRHDLLQMDVHRTWVAPRRRRRPTRTISSSLHRTVSYRDMDYMSHAMRLTIGQLRVSSHTLEIEAGRAARPSGSKVPRETDYARWRSSRRSTMYVDARHIKRSQGDTIAYSERVLVHLVES